MSASPAPEFIKLLAHDLRWSILKALTLSDLQVNELVEQVHEPMNLVSYHLKKMRADAVVTTRRSEADGRDMYYSLDLENLREKYQQAAAALHPAIGSNVLSAIKPALQRQRILFVCTHNSARSQMAEGILRHLSQGQLDVFSAGSQPTKIHPTAISTMKKLNVDIREQRARSLQEYLGQSFDYVITVCDKAREVCPTFPGDGTQMHWGFPDPTVIDDEGERKEIFEHIAVRLISRIEYFMSTLPTLPHESEP